MNLQEQLEKYAESDLRLARKKGMIGLAQTKLGLLNLHYNANDRTYELVQCGAEPTTIASGKKSVVKAAIVAAYDVITK